MSRALAVLRPEPGNAATAARIEAAGHRVLRLPLIAVQPLAWAEPDLSGVDALLVTSAHAIRHAGPGLGALRHLPVVAVGAATAQVALAAGFDVKAVGDGGVAAALRLAAGQRLLHLAGRDRAGETGLPTLVVYGNEALAVDPAPLLDTVALVHSPRAGARLAQLATDRARIAVAAISGAALDAAGGGWRARVAAAIPTDAALIDAARSLAD